MNSNFTYFDSHTHKKYKEQDVAFIRNAYHHLTYQQLDKLNYFFSVGVHPWDINAYYSQSLIQLTSTVIHANCVALGECGLDYHIKTDHDLQKKVFLAQKEMAESINKPVIIHCVKAYHDLLPLIKKSSVPIVLHHYTANLEITQSLLSEHVYFSFGKQLFSKSYHQEVIDYIPLDKMLLETDNSPMHIEEVYVRMAALKDLEFEALKLQIRNNAQDVFSLD